MWQVNFAESCKHTKLSIWDGYVTDIESPDFAVCEQLKYYHKNFKSYVSKSNRIVVNFEGLKFMSVNHELEKFKAAESKQQESQSSDIFRRLFNTSVADERRELAGFSLIWTSVGLGSEACDGFVCKGEFFLVGRLEVDNLDLDYCNSNRD